MKAIVVKPGAADSIHMRDMPDPVLTADLVAVRVLRVGVCATDREINKGQYGKAPDGEEFLILGHENFGVVEEVGRKVTGFRHGDLVVSTVRRPCGHCHTCLHGELDMCLSGDYTERGIIGRHGFMAHYYVEAPEWLNKIPRAVADVGVLLEPMSIVEKGIDQAFRVQKRLPWKPETALVLGAGPVGLLATAVLRARGLDAHVIAREPEGDLRARLVRKLGATYHQVAEQTFFDVAAGMPPIDLAIEATGAASVVFGAMQILGRNGVLCLLSVTSGNKTAEQPIDKINQRIVLGNQIVFGSVNANPRHFATGVKDFALIEKQWPGVLKQLITDRLPWDDFRAWFGERGAGIKSTLEIGS
jgi:threonine dehydrogenase-like Zn-dependent dehydrogenase